MMKRMIALFMALLLVAAVPTTAFAAEANESKNMAEGTVQYYVSSTFTVEIPEYIDVTSNANFSVTEMNIAPTASITVGLYNQPSDGLYTLTHTSLSDQSVKIKMTSDDYGYVTAEQPTLAVINYGDFTSTPFRAELVNEDNAVLSAGAYRGTVTFVFTLNEGAY